LLAGAIALLTPAAAAAAEDLVAYFPTGSGNGVTYGPGDGGYKIAFDAFQGERVRTFAPYTPVPPIAGPSMTVSVKSQLIKGAVADIALIFGASEKGWYYAVMHEDSDRFWWSVGHHLEEGNRYQAIIAEDIPDDSETINDLDDGNEISVTILRREGDKPLLTLRINGAQVAQVSALHDADDPLSPFGAVGVQATAYSGQGEAAYFFRDLTVTP